jgi:hypothetical protein
MSFHYYRSTPGLRDEIQEEKVNESIINKKTPLKC